MTNEGTRVDITELETFQRNANSRSEDVEEISRKVAGVHIGIGMFGQILESFAENAAAGQRQLASTLSTMKDALREDATKAQDNARNVATHESAQSDQFNRTERP